MSDFIQFGFIFQIALGLMIGFCIAVDPGATLHQVARIKEKVLS